MRKPRSFFVTSSKPSAKQLEELGYDSEFDKQIIETSLISQYHFLPSELEEMKHSDYFKLIAGLNSESLLANVIRIRKETDPQKIRDFGLTETQLRVEWQSFLMQLEQ